MSLPLSSPIHRASTTARVLFAVGLGCVVGAGAPGALPAYADGRPSSSFPIGAATPVFVPAEGPPRGTVIGIHGGAWIFTGAFAIEALRPQATWFSRHGYDVWLISHRPGRAAVMDVVHAYDAIRARLTRSISICAYGESSGGHLALMLAAHRRSLRCAVAAAAITDPKTLHGVVGDGLRSMLSADGLRRWSPAAKASAIGSRALLGQAANDEIVEPSQLQRFAAADPRARIVSLGGGSAGDPFWIHSRVARSSLERWNASMLAFLSDRLRR
jgi:hypothetical protein